MGKLLTSSDRLDLQKQQEINNYQKARSDMFQEIRKIKESIEELDISHTEYHVALSNDLNDKIMELDKRLSNISENYDDTRIVVREQGNISHSLSKNMSEIHDATNKLLVRVMDCETDIRTLNAAVTDLLNENKSIENRVMQALDRWEATFREEIKASQRYVLSQPSGVDKVKKEVEEKLSCHIVDVKGISRELAFYKKENMIMHKEIEHLFTLVERMKNQIGE